MVSSREQRMTLRFSFYNYHIHDKKGTDLLTVDVLQWNTRKEYNLILILI